MTVSPIRLQGWRGPGCGDDCLPRSHDPVSHERYGYERCREDMRPRIVRTGPLTIDLNARTVVVDGASVLLSDLHWALLAHLAERLDSWCPMDDLIAVIGSPATRLADENRTRNAFVRMRVPLGAAGHLIISGGNGRPSRRLVYVEPAP